MKLSPDMMLCEAALIFIYIKIFLCLLSSSSTLTHCFVSVNQDAAETTSIQTFCCRTSQDQVHGGEHEGWTL